MLRASLSEGEQQTLARIAGLIIPASDIHGVPGADDATIVAEMVAAAYSELSADLAVFENAGNAEGYRQEHPVAAGRVQKLVVECYYRDDRVMISLGLEARPPFPKGFDVEQGDWSLLDPVRAMKPIYRPVQ